MADERRSRIRCVRKGSAGWNEDDRLQLAMLLIKAGYTARIARRTIPGTGNSKTPRREYMVEYWEEADE